MIDWMNILSAMEHSRQVFENVICMYASKYVWADVTGFRVYGQVNMYDVCTYVCKYVYSMYGQMSQGSGFMAR
jgi:hypothetical protein